MDKESKLKLVVNNPPSPVPFIHPNFFARPEKFGPIAKTVKEDILSKEISTIEDAFRKTQWFSTDGKIDFIYLPLEHLVVSRSILCLAYHHGGDKSLQTIVFPQNKPCVPMSVQISIELENSGPPKEVG